MKTVFFALALLLCGGAVAQNPYIALQGASDSEAGVVVSQPRTLIGVDVTVERDVTLCGPYARYAQKFLGVRAPLTDKTTWSVKSASVSLLSEREAFGAPDLAGPQSQSMIHAADEEAFARIQPDKTDMTAPALEDAARAAANTIFSLRRHRMELITGEAGEHVFGEGLEAALSEIERLEQAYLELFLGKRTVSSQTRRFVVWPQADKKQYIVCRFSATDGLLPESDLSGDMVLLQVEPEAAQTVGLEAGIKVRDVVACRVAASTTCTVICGGREYGRTVLPVFEYGRTINVTRYR